MEPEVAYSQFLRSALMGDTADGWFRLGCCLDQLRRWPAAAAAFARAVERDPGHFQALTNLGWHQHLTGRHQAAWRSLERAIELAPGEGKAYGLLSQVLLTLDYPAEAAAAAARGSELDPAPVNHVALGFAQAACGRWDEAWSLYEHRFAYKLPQFLSRPMRLWRGEEVERLYLEAEQGLGDAIFSLRWLPGAAERAKEVVLYVHRPLHPLVLNQPGLPANVEVLPLPQAAVPEADAWCPLLSLPVALERGEPWFPGAPYLEAIDKKTPALFGDARHIGIAWRGNPEHEQAHHRDCHLVYWEPLIEIPGIRLHSLQFGDGQDQLQELLLHGLINDRSGEINSMANTATVVAGLDLVIAVDTGVAHLAGAMGKPVWLLVNKRGADFRWLRGEERSGWYPNTRIFWRELDEQWSDVMDRVAKELRQ